MRGSLASLFSKLSDYSLKLRPFRFGAESDDVYVVLVCELFSSVLPATIMALIFVGVGVFVGSSLESPLVLAVTAAGGLLSAARVGIIVAFRRRPLPPRSRGDANSWELGYALVSVGFAATVALMGVVTISTRDLALQLVVTGLLFSFCSGIVARASIRPGFAIMTVTTAAVPVVVALIAHGGSAHWVLAALILTLLGGSIESIRYVHGAASRQIEMRLDMATLAHSDPLTGLANRLGLRNAFRDMIRNDRHLPIVALHSFDLDRFKPVNDRYGHPAGDALLRILAERIEAGLRNGDVAARIGGDEFVVLQTAIRHADEAELFAHRLARAITSPFEIESNRIQVGVSLGYALCPPGKLDLDELVATADAALYGMKRSGGGVARGEQDKAVA